MEDAVRAKKLRTTARMTSGFGIALIVVSFLVFLLYGNVAPGIVILALGVVFVVAGGKKGALPGSRGV